MSQRTQVYICTVLFAGLFVSGVALSGITNPLSHWPVFLVFTLLATVTQLFKVEAPNHQLYYTTPVFLFAGLLLLPPSLFILLIIIAYTVEWAKERKTKSPYLREWYVQPFNAAVDILAATAARWVLVLLVPSTGLLFSPPTVLTVIAAAVTYVIANHLLVGLALVLAHGIPWLESGILAPENLLNDFVLVCLGYIIAILWQLNPWLILPALLTVLLMHQALLIPQLKYEAQTDAKTGLWNARHFMRLFMAEMERANRFERSLALIMADLDLLRNINNTYGHLAGDLVLEGIGNIIRSTIREYDIAGRFGGEEFVILLPEADLPEARALAERLRLAVERTPFFVPTSRTPIYVTMSFGIACFPLDAVTANALIHEADIAVYAAKLNGRNCIMAASDVVHRSAMDLPAMADRFASP